MATVAQWIEGARPRTLPMAAAPVIVGSAAAFDLEAFDPTRALLALLIALLFQIGMFPWAMIALTLTYWPMFCRVQTTEILASEKPASCRFCSAVSAVS